MKKFFLISLFLTLNILFVYSILRPMNKEVGAIIGRISLKSFTSWKINLYLKNNETGSIFIITPWNNKYYFLLNLKPGSYTLYKFGISLTTSYSITWARDLQLAKDGINIIIEPNKITPINFLEIYIGADKYGVNIDNIDKNEYISDLKEYFKGLDKRGFWKDFEWSELKTGNDLITEKM